MRREVYQRFMSYVHKRPDGCWEWIGGRTGAHGTCEGYGNFKIDGVQRGAHVWMFEHHKGPVGKKLVCHTCDRSWCVRPKHLFKGTYRVNTLDAISKGRFTQHRDAEMHRKIGIKLRGRVAPNKGVPMRTSTKRLLSKANRGKKRTLEQRLNYARAAKKREANFKRMGLVRVQDARGVFTGELR